MEKFKPYSYAQGQLIPEMFSKQIQPDTFEFILNHLIDSELDLSCFVHRFNNDETGIPAFDPRIRLKIILFAYSRGLISSRKIPRCCEENVIFTASSAKSRPHFTTISDFISSMDKEAIANFRALLLFCDQMGLTAKEMFASDGCNPPSKASKEWSDTRADFKKKAAKMEKAKDSYIENMKRKIDSTVGRAMNAMRLAIAELPFAHICRVKRLDRFTMCGKWERESQQPMATSSYILRR